MFHRSAIGGLHRFAGLHAPPSRPGPAAPKPSGAGGFSLLEIVVVLALFGLISVLLIGGSGALLRAVSQDDAENTALSAIAAARHGAVLAGQTLQLRVDEQARVLDWGAGNATISGEDGVRLLPPVKLSSILIGGRVQEEALAGVRFYADGTCDPFRLEIVRDKTSRILTIDPWTCTVLAPDAQSRSR
jgi:prepilin-type N-terminal cleavage/methylation domain-containing protein